VVAEPEASAVEEIAAPEDDAAAVEPVSEQAQSDLEPEPEPEAAETTAAADEPKE